MASPLEFLNAAAWQTHSFGISRESHAAVHPYMLLCGLIDPSLNDQQSLPLNFDTPLPYLLCDAK